MSIQINAYPPSPKQWQFLNAFKPSPKPQIVHWVAGRRGGKTAGLVFQVFRSAFVLNPQFPGAVTFPTGPDIDKIFWPLWKEMIPGYLWSRKRTSRGVEYIQMLNGTRVYLLSREIRNKNAEPGRGPKYAWLIHDELAKDPNKTAWQTFLPTVEIQKAPCKFIATTSTPKPNWYRRLVKNSEARGDTILRSTSWDNPYVDPEVFEGLKDEFDEDYVRQELYAEFVNLSERIWYRWVDSPWPDGNIFVGARFDPDRPWMLACDIGQRSSWLVVQLQQTNTQYPVYAAVAEYTPNDGDAIKMVDAIRHDYGNPSHIYTGNDTVNTRSYATDGSTCAYTFRQRGWDCPIHTPRGIAVHKRVQHDQLCGMIVNHRKQRRFTASDNLVSHNRRFQRGILEVIEGDVWPEEKTADYMPKDKAGGPGFEDTRDAMLYMAVGLNPPTSARFIEDAA